MDGSRRWRELRAFARWLLGLEELERLALRTLTVVSERHAKPPH